MTNRMSEDNTSGQPEPQDYYQSNSRPARQGYQRQSIGEAAAKSFIRSIAASLGRILVRTITGRMR